VSLEDLALAVLAGIVIFEIAEHVIFPLVWSFRARKSPSLTGASGLVGETAKVGRWQGTRGQVRVHGEIWRASADAALAEGDLVVVEKVDGLTLTVRPRADRVEKAG